MNELSVYADSTAEVVEQLRAAQRAVAVAQAEKVRLATMLYRRRRCQELELRVNPAFAGQSTATEIGVALKISQRQADREIDLGLALENRLPRTRKAFGEGRIDLIKAQVIATELQNVDDSLVAELEPRIAEYAQAVDPSRLKRTIRRWVLQADPAGQAERRKRAERDRYVQVSACDDGTATLEAVLPAAGGQTVYERVREMARTQCCGADGRTVNQRRADALVALADGSGRLACQCGRRECPYAGADVAESRKPLVQVGVSAETLAGLQDNPGLLAGFGAIDAELARQLARHARFQVFPESETTTLDRGGNTGSISNRHGVGDPGSGFPHGDDRDGDDGDRGFGDRGNGREHRDRTDRGSGDNNHRCGSDQGGGAHGSGHNGGGVDYRDHGGVGNDRGSGHIDRSGHDGDDKHSDRTDRGCNDDHRCGSDQGGSDRRGNDRGNGCEMSDNHRGVNSPGSSNRSDGAGCGSKDKRGKGASDPTVVAGSVGESRYAATGSGDAGTGLRYRPGARLAARVRALDGVCRAPGCQIPAAATDVDHHVPFVHADPVRGGHTIEDNLSCRCRRHHRLKTLADNEVTGWRVRQHPGRRQEWVTPTGESVITEPEGAAYLFPRVPVPPAAVIDVPALDPDARSPIDPGVFHSELAELIHVYVPPSKRRRLKKLPNHRVYQHSSEEPPF